MNEWTKQELLQEAILNFIIAQNELVTKSLAYCNGCRNDGLAEEAIKQSYKISNAINILQARLQNFIEEEEEEEDLNSALDPRD